MTETCKDCKYWRQWRPYQGQPSKFGDCMGEPPQWVQKTERWELPRTAQDHESCRYFVQGPHRKAREMQSAEHKGGGNYGTKDSIPF